MKQVLNFDGEIVIEDLPVPTCDDNQILVGNVYSLISTGTETTSLKKKGMVTGTASTVINNPTLIKKAINLIKKEGLTNALKIIQKTTNKSLIPLGYSSSGVVLEVGNNINDIAVGDRVACAGAGYANHAEIITVPRKLLAKIPENVDFSEAAFTTVGAIAMQGIRRAKVELGDKIVVLGMGLLGLIAVQILKAAGVYVIGLDIAKERLELAESLGADKCIINDETSLNEVLKYTEGLGADSVIIYAATESSDPVRQAMKMVRKKGKVVVVGDVGMEIERSPFYEKELDFLISTSYGPGRYDKSYEEDGIDYPIGYVKWTENRNMQEFLNLISNNKINLKKLINKTYLINDAKQAYLDLTAKKRPIGILFKYKKFPDQKVIRKVQLQSPSKLSKKINVAVIGAGAFVQAFHLPNLKKITNYNIKAIVTKTGSNAKKLAEEFGAEYFTTDYREVLDDETVDLVIIATRHNLHAPLIIEAAESKKNIFVEKPIAMNFEDCKRVYNAIIENHVNLTIGFNRRMSKFAQITKDIVNKRKNPLIIVYRVNSAGMKKDHWINDPKEGGGAIIGEACHFFDFCNWLVNEKPHRIYAEMISSTDEDIINNNNIVSNIKYEDGSIASVIYTTIGNESFSKERIEIFVDNGVICINDFKEIKFFGIEERDLKFNRIDKGQYELMKRYGKFLMKENNGKEIPTVQDGINATICSLKVLYALKTGKIQSWL